VATLQPKGENVRQAVKWISGELKEDENKSIPLLIQDAALKFNLSPKDEAFLCVFYQENKM
jgi:hypothetical protein